MNTYTSQPPAMQKPSSGKKWWVYGCGGCLGVVVVLGASVMAFIVFVVMASIKSTEAYAEAKQAALNSPQLKQAIGEPIEEGFMLMGSVSNTNGNKAIDFAMPVSGPNGTASVVVKGTKPAGAAAWEYSVFEAQLADKDETKIPLK